ncbi:hypothetical protein EZS27_029802 [termite gut metagenome]|uniref:Uncharacterized protein n=1 Tax=termite gut metagenome TaxID=433724 RepID=A0A5J4QGP9_9ZZZZ
MFQLLETDLYNFRTLDLYCEIIGKQRKPQELFNFLRQTNMDYNAINSNTLINIAEILSSVRENSQYQILANKILSIALSGQIEESQIAKAVVNLKKVGEPEEVIKFVSEAIVKYPNLSSSSTLLEKRATARMDMAKKCIDTGKDVKSNPKTKARAWEMCRQFLEEAERDLNKASDYADDPNEKFFIENDMNFLERMKKNSAKPTSPLRSRASLRKRG